MNAKQTKEFNAQMKRLVKAFPRNSVSVTCEVWRFIPLIYENAKAERTTFNAYVSMETAEGGGFLCHQANTPTEAVNDVLNQCRNAGIEFVE
jgi:hypothetical protein